MTPPTDPLAEHGGQVVTKKRSIGGLVMHFVGERCLDAVCGYQPKRGWATPDGLNVHRRECRPCVQLVMSVSPAAETMEARL